ncbi:MAG: DUF86 domain-containing protein [Chloroflexota bacterium]|nr:DUF86 domain-containing protein [Chloroflexota bacterium]
MENADDIVASRLKLLAEYVDELHGYQIQAISFHTYQDNKMLRRAVERALQVAMEVCLDIGRRIIAVEGFRYPETNQDVFRILAEEGVLPADLLPTLLEMARFRNLIVHDYARIDDARVYVILKKRLGDFDAFAEIVRTYLVGDEAPEPPDVGLAHLTA